MGHHLTQSPIEDALFDGLKALDDERLRFVADKTINEFTRRLSDDWEGKHLFVAPQVKIGRYRVDFLFGQSRGIAPKLLIVECDGQQFHRANYDQIDRDCTRDGELLIFGIPTMRFTGSQIFRDQWRCARRAVEMISPAPEAGDFVHIGSAAKAATTARDERWEYWKPRSRAMQGEQQ